MQKATVADQFSEFINENPMVYQMFKQFAFDLIQSGRKRLSGNMIVERVRWETAIKTTGDDYKINDKFTSHLVRKLISDFPSMKDRFSLRTLRVA